MRGTSGRRWAIGASALFAVVVLPLCGVLAAGRPIDLYLEFPPRTRLVVHAPFSWTIFLALTACILVVLAPLVVRILRTGARYARPDTFSIHRREPRRDAACSRTALPQQQLFPWWGWVGLIWTVFAWALAWNRWAWVGDWQLHTFTPLWLGYIVVMNALTVSRIGTSVFQRLPGRFLLLFPLSAVFWWSFEYLNRFVQNWYYLGGREFTSTEYFLVATVPFSTVLPAVISTADWLSTYPHFNANAALNRAWIIPGLESKSAGGVMVFGAAVGLVGLGLWPDYLFPLVWVAPLLLIVGLQLVSGEETVFRRAARGDWRSVWIAALAALICGLFWELWNSRSLAHWEYAIPFTHRFQLFEMPLLGYAGYLPFGLECLVVVQLFIPADWIKLSEANEASAKAGACTSGALDRCLGEQSPTT
jgi:hypothetical protein